MGTSCLEGARLGIPSILYDFSYNHISLDYKFNWLYESAGYVLGRDITTLESININTFEEVLNQVYIDNKKKQIAELSLNYFQGNHEIKAVSELLIKKLNNNNLTYKKLKKANIQNVSIKFHLFGKLYSFLMNIKSNLKFSTNP